MARMSLGETRRSTGSLAILSDRPTTRPRAMPPPASSDRVAARPVVAAAAPARAQLRRPAVLAQADDQRLVEQPARVEVDQEARERAVEARQELVLHPGEVVPVGVPAGAGQAVLVPEDGDEPAPRLDQPPRRQRGLAEEGHAVEVAGGGRLAVEVEGAAAAAPSRAASRPSRGGGRSPTARPPASRSRRACSHCSRRVRRRSRRSSVSSGPRLGDRRRAGTGSRG